MKIKFLLILSLLYLLSFKVNWSLASVREPAVAGAFYPGSKESLKQQVDKYISQAQITPQDKNLFALLVPHAGYIYSGPVAGHAYKLLKYHKEKFDTIVLLGVNHRIAGFSQNSVYAGEAYRTPLGNLLINKEILNRLLKYDEIVFKKEVHLQEHSLEVQIPFLQQIKDFKIVPLIIGNYSKENCSRVADILIKELVKKKEKVLFLSSTDFSHFHPYDTAEQMDKKAIRDILTLNLNNFTANHQNRKTELCGYGGVLICMYMAQKLGYTDIELLKYANSGDTAGRKNSVVGYAAMAFYSTNTQNIKKDGGKMEQKEAYTKEEKEFLLKIARKTVENFVREGKVPSFETENPKFSENRGAFVTLHKKGRLSGCIGYIEPIKPLLNTVIENAVNACSKDYRFPKVSENELEDIDIEISILSLPEKIKSQEEIVIGKHGVILEKGFNKAVFLPQVAPQQGWGVAETLENLCYKAGLNPHAWKEGAELFVFTASVFGEKEE